MGLYDATFPNIELLVYKAEQVYRERPEFREMWKKAKEEKNALSLVFSVEVFPQLWGSTCLGFDVCSDGSPAIGGCAITKAYTTVVHEEVTDQYFVFFNSELCYIADRSEKFLRDLRDHNLLPLSHARKCY